MSVPGYRNYGRKKSIVPMQMFQLSLFVGPVPYYHLFRKCKASSRGCLTAALTAPLAALEADNGIDTR